jgi:hypothetical protein
VETKTHVTRLLRKDGESLAETYDQASRRDVLNAGERANSWRRR